MTEIKVIIHVIDEATGKVHIDELDKNQEYFYLIEKALKNKKNPIEAINYMLCLGSRKLYAEDNTISTETYIGD